jgi:putative membrane protein
MKQKRWNQVLITFLCSISGLLVLNVANVWAQQPRGDYYGPHMMWNSGWWYGMFFGPILMIVFIGIAVVVVVLLVRWLGGSIPGLGSPTPTERDPLDILKERFARGEIDKEEFEERRKVLRE